jgi:heme A synthase
VALGLLLLQVLLGAVTVKLQLPPWTVILHLGTAMLLLATLIVAARGHPIGFARSARHDVAAAVLGFVTVLFGGLTANLGAATACIGFPLCNGQLVPSGNALQYIQWTHRLLAYALFAYLVVWTVRSGRRGVAVALGLVAAQIGIAATMVLLTVPKPLQAAHAAAGATVWAALVLAATRAPTQNRTTSA